MLRKALAGFVHPLQRFVAQRGRNLGAPQHRRTVISGPPKYPISAGEQVILGVGFLGIIMILPLWGVYSIPAWSRAHKETDTPPPEGEEEEEYDDED